MVERLGITPDDAIAGTSFCWSWQVFRCASLTKWHDNLMDWLMFLLFCSIDGWCSLQCSSWTSDGTGKLHRRCQEKEQNHRLCSQPGPTCCSKVGTNIFWFCIPFYYFLEFYFPILVATGEPQTLSLRSIKFRQDPAIRSKIKFVNPLLVGTN